MTINEQNYAYGASKSSIREIAAYGSARKAQIGAENVFDFSLGNPSIPAPDAVRESIERSLQLPPTQLHSYTPASGLPFVREKLAASLCRRYGENTAAADDLYLTCGAAASLSACRQYRGLDLWPRYRLAGARPHGSADRCRRSPRNLRYPRSCV